MKLAIISDTHLGFALGTARERDSFDQARQALELAIQHGAEAILLPGDVFDDPIPKQEVWNEGFRLFAIPIQAPNSSVRLTKAGQSHSYSGIPLIAIHGTHELRTKDYKNALEVMQSAGFMCYIHGQTCTLEKDGEKVVVHGLGGVPEKYALTALQQWAPKPVDGAHNILMLHQSFSEFLPFGDEMTATLSLSHLPAGFDLVVNGHLHWTNELELKQGGKFLLPGSTVSTQMKQLESQRPKGFILYDTQSRTIAFVDIPVQRKMFYHKEKVQGATPNEILQKVRGLIAADVQQNKQPLAPLIRVKVVGKLASGMNASDLSFSEIEKEFSNQAILSLDKDFDSLESLKQSIEGLRSLQKNKKSIAAVGLELLEKNLSETSFDNAFDVRRIFELLAQGEIETVQQLLMEEKQ